MFVSLIKVEHGKPNRTVCNFSKCIFFTELIPLLKRGKNDTRMLYKKDLQLKIFKIYRKAECR